MSDFSVALSNFSGSVRLFPLPNFVLFPGVVQPFHLFEPRYRKMLLDSMADDKLIAVGQLRPGWEEEYEGRPPIFDTICVGKVMAHTPLPDGCHNILLTGLSRGRVLSELEIDEPYRIARVELMPDANPTPNAGVGLRKKLIDVCRQLAGKISDSADAIEEFLASEAQLGQIADVLAFALNIPASEKQALLAERDATRRARRILSSLRNLAAHTVSPATQSSAGHKFPPDFSLN